MNCTTAELFSSSHFISGKQTEDEQSCLHFSQVHCWLERKNVSIILELWLPLGPYLWRIYFRLRNTVRQMIFQLWFFPFVSALILIFLRLFSDLRTSATLYTYLGNLFARTFLGNDVGQRFCHWGLQNLLFQGWVALYNVMDQVNNFIGVQYSS